ncbi:DUF2934 domain-containing protein [Methylobacterium goesingense]|uniref:DUF2934 domain-containing protein n=1 Tax=Methylobacterium goesingense TaxID=243690 RepID=A0ABV2L4S7_9HYPH|nr:DUF2934 domain-containing protein [Methylobacterium goesingense]GJD72845.1 hypothetical protein CFIICLFH_1069 [Methylobacterium goesingense]
MPSPPDITSREITFEEIRERAYDLWERHHRPEGFSIELWLMAERELRAEREGRRPGRPEPESAPAPAEPGTAAKPKASLERIAS